MSKIVNCEYSKIIMDEPTCNAFDVNRHGEIICSEENCIILKLKEQLQAKEQECEALKGENFTFVELIKTQEELIDKYEQALDDIEQIAQTGLKPICYKSNCSRCKCYNNDDCKAGTKALLLNYFDKNGNFVDGNDDFFDELDFLVEKERKSCNRAKPISQKILDIIHKTRTVNNE